MDGWRVRERWGRWLVVLTLGLASCTPGTPVENLPPADQTLAAAGKRLSQAYSAEALTVMAARGDRVLAVLTRAERDALGRGYTRFRIDRPADVFVAAPRGSLPFWLADQGFEPAGFSLTDPQATWDVYRKRFPPGWIGLGVNGLDRRSPAHYAVLLRSPDGRPIRPTEFDRDVWQVATAVDGASLTSGQASPVVRIPDPVRGATLLRASDDHRHATLLARGRVWKTHVVSGRLPDQVAVSFGADPSRELTWSWRTAPEVRRSIVRLRKAGDPSVREVAGGSEPIALREVINDPVVLRHTVRVSGLEPGTDYEYALGNGTPEGTTDWAEIRSAPAASSDVSLIYMGDPQCGLEGWGKLLASAYRKRPDAAAVLIAGDLVDRGNERTNWDHFFLRAAGVFERLPVMPCIGNHEYLDRGPWLYRSFFALPENGPRGVESDLVYQFEVGDAFVAVLDSTRAVTSPAEAARQAEWLDEALSRTRRTWKLVMFHHPVYASHTSRESPGLRDAWVPVFDRHHVDVVLQGHDHAYLRTYPLRADRRVESAAEGTVYVVSVSGDKYYDQDPREYTEVGFTNVSTYQTIDLNPREDRLVYRSFDASGRQRDAFTIEKPVGPRQVAATR